MTEMATVEDKPLNSGKLVENSGTSRHIIIAALGIFGSYLKHN